MSKNPGLSSLTIYSQDPEPLFEALVCLGGTPDIRQCGHGSTVRTVHFESMGIEIINAPEERPTANPPTLTFIVDGSESAGAVLEAFMNSGVKFEKLGGLPIDTWRIRFPNAHIRVERHDEALVEALKQETGVATG